jgi:hypothetical protein
MGRLSNGLRIGLYFLLFGILLIGIFSWRSDVFFRGGSIDIHTNDTYFVFAKSHVLIGVLVFLLFLFSLGGVIGSRLKNRVYIVLFLVASSFVVYIIWLLRDFPLRALL